MPQQKKQESGRERRWSFRYGGHRRSLQEAQPGLCKIHYLADGDAPPTLTITTGASTTGLGAILACPKGRPQAWFADLMWEEVLARFGATAGDPAWMAEFELLAILVALAA